MHGKTFRLFLLSWAAVARRISVYGLDLRHGRCLICDQSQPLRLAGHPRLFGISWCCRMLVNGLFGVGMALRARFRF